LQGIAVDKDDDVYIAEGRDRFSNHRIVVLDHEGHFLRQWEIQRTPGDPANWAPMPECINIDVDGNVYVCDRFGGRMLIYDKMGHFKNYLPIPIIQRTVYTSTEKTDAGGHWGTVIAIFFSTDPDQKYLFNLNEDDEEVMVFDRKTLKLLTTFGRVGAQVGEFNHVHYGQMDSHGNLYLGEVNGNRLDRYQPAENH
jgi:DNA-binding beta-propeller fold protein YncE